jgi:hypothetical protein
MKTDGDRVQHRRREQRRAARGRLSHLVPMPGFWERGASAERGFAVSLTVQFLKKAIEIPNNIAISIENLAIVIAFGFLNPVGKFSKDVHDFCNAFFRHATVQVYLNFDRDRMVLAQIVVGIPHRSVHFGWFSFGSVSSRRPKLGKTLSPIAERGEHEGRNPSPSHSWNTKTNTRRRAAFTPFPQRHHFGSR